MQQPKTNLVTDEESGSVYEIVDISNEILTENDIKLYKNTKKTILVNYLSNECEIGYYTGLYNIKIMKKYHPIVYKLSWNDFIKYLDKIDKKTIKNVKQSKNFDTFLKVVKQLPRGYYSIYSLNDLFFDFVKKA